MKVFLMFAASAVSAVFVLPTVSQAETINAYQLVAKAAGQDCEQQQLRRFA